MAKNIHVKIYCNACGSTISHMTLPNDRNFHRIDIDPCEECLQGAYSAGSDPPPQFNEGVKPCIK